MMGQNQENFQVTPQAKSIKEDWGGDGRGRMNLSGRSTAISPDYVPRQHQFFNSNTAPEVTEWRIKGIPATVLLGTKRLLSWHQSGASTSKVTLSPQFKIPGGIFTADLEIFVLQGAIQVGEWQLDKHTYSFIPAGVRFADWQLLGDEPVEILWMENGPIPLSYQAAECDRPDARMNEFIPALDSKILPWGKTDTVQFEVSKKKWLRKDDNGGGVWLLALLPHYDGQYQMIQSYNEEAYCLVGYCDIGDYHCAQDHVGYCPSFSTLPWHRSDDGGLFLIRVDRDLSQSGTVLSYVNRF